VFSSYGIGNLIEVYAFRCSLEKDEAKAVGSLGCVAKGDANAMSNQ
jgi:hypothetical protein